MEKKKPYEAPSIKKVRLDIHERVLGGCQTSTDLNVSPTCQIGGGPCISPT